MREHGYMLTRALRSCAVARANRVALRLGGIIDAVSSGDAVEAGNRMHEHFQRHE